MTRRLFHKISQTHRALAIQVSLAILIVAMVVMGGSVLAWMYFRSAQIHTQYDVSLNFHTATVLHLNHIELLLERIAQETLGVQDASNHEHDHANAPPLPEISQNLEYLLHKMTIRTTMVSRLSERYDSDDRFGPSTARLTDRIAALSSAFGISHDKRWLERAVGQARISVDQLKRLHADSDHQIITQLASMENRRSIGFMLWVGVALTIGGGLVFWLAREITSISNQLDDSIRLYAKAEQIGELGHWNWSLNDSRLTSSPEFKRLLGIDADDKTLSLKDVVEAIHPADQNALTDIIESTITHGTAQSLECRVNRSDETQTFIHLSCEVLRHQKGKPDTLVGIARNITANKLLERTLWNQAHKDHLTGLNNRTQMHNLLDRVCQNAAANSQLKFAVLFLDFDRFKVINDSLGHEIGDMLLQHIVQRITHTLGTLSEQFPTMQFHAARLGGDEFLILLEGLENDGDVHHVATQLLAVFSAPHNIRGYKLFSTASIGIVTNDANHQGPEDIIRNADLAMYEAKSLGKACYVVFDERMRKKAVQRLEIENDLRSALDEGQLRLHYQPMVCLENGKLVGFEALLRWQHPDRGMIMPDEFIHVAEEAGLIEAIGEWVLRTACRQLRQWQQRAVSTGELFMSINISKNQLAQHDLVDRVKQILAETGVQPGDIKLEVTESLIMRSLSATVSVLQQLHDLGVRIAMDDFGTGLSSLSYLDRFPIDVLKIDRGFIMALDSDRGYSAIVHAIITLAHNLKMQVVAEGVSSNAHVAQLQALECDLAQGYYFSKPIEPAACEDLIFGKIPLNRSA